MWEGGLRHLLDLNPGAARDRDTVNVIVGECFDGWLSDARALAVRAEHALEAIAAAVPDDTSEGAVGAGTGTTCFGFKSGVGTSSRSVDGHVLGCLVVSNYGATTRPADAGRPGRGAARPGRGAARDGGSIMIVAGHGRTALRAPAPAAGGARAHSASAARAASPRNSSGEYVISFSTAQTVPHRVERDRDEFSFLRDDSVALHDLFEAAGDVVQESILNSLCSAEAMEGRDGNRAEAFPIELLERVGRGPQKRRRAPQGPLA